MPNSPQTDQPSETSKGCRLALTCGAFPESLVLLNRSVPGRIPVASRSASVWHIRRRICTLFAASWTINLAEICTPLSTLVSFGSVVSVFQRVYAGLKHDLMIKGCTNCLFAGEDPSKSFFLDASSFSRLGFLGRFKSLRLFPNSTH